MEKNTEAKNISELVAGKRVLIVEDDEGLNKLIQKSLRRSGFDCFGVTSGADAIESVKKNPNQALLIDQQLPDMNGTDLVRSLIEHTHDIIFVAMTGHGDEKIAVEMMKLGAKDYLIKGFDLTDILPMVFKRVFSELETEKKLVRAEEALQETNARHSSMMANIGDVIGIMGVDGLMKYKSPNIERWFGWKPEDLVGTDGWETIHPEEIERIQKEFYALLEKENASTTVEYRYKCKDGTYTWIELVAVNCINDTTINGILLNYHDISDRKQAENDLRKSEEKFRATFRTSPDAINLNRAEDGLYIDINDGFTKIMGYSREDIIGKSSLEFNIWNDSKDREKLVSGLKKNGLVENLEVKFISKDGQIKTGLMSARILSIENENTILSITRDITEKKQIEDQLKRSEERYRKYFEEDLSGSYISTPEGQLIACNKEYLKIFGFKNTQEALKTPISKIFETFGERAVFLQTIAKEKKIINKESKFQKLDGAIISVVENASGVFNENGELKEIRGFILDLTEQRRLESQIQQSQKMESIGTLAGGIAHDFNNILFPILGHTEMLLEDVPVDSPFREGLSQIYNSALRARDLVQQILTFSRHENAELKLMKMQPIIKEALKLIRSTIPSTISIDQNLQPNCGAVKADPTQIHQIVMNLTTNAYHAMEETGGELKVSLKEVKFGTLDLISPDMVPGAYACLTVADTGVGMDKNLTDKIFDPFFTTKAIGKGTGMGLSVVHGIVTAMGGAIQVYSEPEKGTQFHAYFPIEKNSFEGQVTNSEAKIQGGTEQILLVDDEEAILTMEKQMLERLGYQVISHTSSLEALETFRDSPDKFDLVITDMAMPNIPGDRLSAELTKIRSDIPVLLCTGFSETMSEEKATSLGIKGFLLKPIVMKDLAQKIREVLDNNKAKKPN